MSKKAEKADAKADEKKEKKGKKGKGQADATAGPSVASHPRASYQVRRAKGWGGLAGFGIAAYLSYKAGVPTSDLGLRALAAGIAGYMLAWACSVTVWRHLVLAELRASVESGSAAPSPDLIPARADAAAKPASPPDDAATPALEGAPAQ
jgi:hypothetical protein